MKRPGPFNKPHVLVAERDLEMQALIGGLLSDELYQIDFASSGPEVCTKIKQNPPQLLISNGLLSELCGVELIRKIREFSVHNLSILMITSNVDPEVKKQYLEAGANDVLTQPFDRALFLGRVRLLLGTYFSREDDDGQKDDKKIRLGELTLDTRSFDAYCLEQRIHLTPSEFKLLHALALHRGSVLSREQLIEFVQGEGIAVIDRAVDTHIFSLRKKLGTYGDAIETVRGAGYRARFDLNY